MLLLVQAAMAASLDPACIEISLQRDGFDREDPPSTDLADELTTRSYTGYERVRLVVSALRKKGCFTDPDKVTASVKVTRYDDPDVVVLDTTPTPLVAADRFELIRAPYAPLYARATNLEAGAHRPYRRPLRVVVEVKEGDATATLERTVTVDHNPLFVPELVTHATLVSTYMNEKEAWVAEVLSVAPVGFHIRATPAPRLAYVGLGADITVLDASVLEVTTDGSGETNLAPAVMPVRVTAGLDFTYDHGFFAGKHVYLYCGVGMQLDDESIVTTVPVSGISMLVPFDVGSK